MAENIAEVRKGDDDWLSISVVRSVSGSTVFMRVDPRVEEFFAKLANSKTDALETIVAWKSVDPIPINVYRNPVVNGNYGLPGFNLTDISLGDASEGLSAEVPLGILRIQGIGMGVRFMVPTPLGLAELRKHGAKIALQARNLFREYIAPATITLRISGTEV